MDIINTALSEAPIKHFQAVADTLDGQKVLRIASKVSPRGYRQSTANSLSQAFKEAGFNPDISSSGPKVLSRSGRGVRWGGSDWAVYLLDADQWDDPAKLEQSLKTAFAVNKTNSSRPPRPVKTVPVPVMPDASPVAGLTHNVLRRVVYHLLSAAIRKESIEPVIAEYSAFFDRSSLVHAHAILLPERDKTFNVAYLRRLRKLAQEGKRSEDVQENRIIEAMKRPGLMGAKRIMLPDPEQMALMVVMLRLNAGNHTIMEAFNQPKPLWLVLAAQQVLSRFYITSRRTQAWKWDDEAPRASGLTLRPEPLKCV